MDTIRTVDSFYLARNYMECLIGVEALVSVMALFFLMPLNRSSNNLFHSESISA